jgi:hypothetical protein
MIKHTNEGKKWNRRILLKGVWLLKYWWIAIHKAGRKANPAE